MTKDDSSGAIRCHNCGSQDLASLYDAGRFEDRSQIYSLMRCSRCHVVVTCPWPSEGHLAAAYSLDYYGNSETKFTSAVERWTGYAARRRARRLVKLCGVGSRPLNVLDVGCGRGVLLRAFAGMGHHAVGVERPGSPFGQQPNVILRPLEDLGLKPASFDLIVLWHVLEHLRSPLADLKSLKKYLAPGGSIIISVPNIASLQARMFKGSWFHLDLPRHLFHFDDGSMTYVSNGLDLKVRRRSTLSLDQGIYGFVQSALNCVTLIPNNHLYALLKSGSRGRRRVHLALYAPFVILLSTLALLELVVSAISRAGPVLTLQVARSD